jgi:hypothetical protein
MGTRSGRKPHVVETRAARIYINVDPTAKDRIDTALDLAGIERSIAARSTEALYISLHEGQYAIGSAWKTVHSGSLDELLAFIKEPT